MIYAAIISQTKINCNTERGIDVFSENKNNTPEILWYFGDIVSFKIIDRFIKQNRTKNYFLILYIIIGSISLEYDFSEKLKLKRHQSQISARSHMA